MRRAGILSGCLLFAGAAFAQTPDPFNRMPPTQGQQQPGQGAAGVNIEALTRQGFEIKAMERASDRANGFVVMLQRAGEVRTCLMRIERDQAQAPRASSLCF